MLGADLGGHVALEFGAADRLGFFHNRLRLDLNVGMAPYRMRKKVVAMVYRMR